MALRCRRSAATKASIAGGVLGTADAETRRAAQEHAVRAQVMAPEASVSGTTPGPP